MAVKEYVAGFLFHDELVALIEKKHPDWQKGCLNGIGGHVEQFEFPGEAMIREFEEETGVRVNRWRLFCVLKAFDDSWIVHFFSARADEFFDLREKTDEIPRWIPVASIPHLGGLVIDNLRWLIPMAIAQSPVVAEVKEIP